MYQEISIDTAVKNQKFYFYDLPKYDENGSVVHYSVKEVYAKKTPDGRLSGTFPERIKTEPGSQQNTLPLLPVSIR